MALSQDMPAQKKRRFSAIDITPSRANGNGDAEGNELTAVVRRWGSAFTVFEGADRDTPLWQLQICHNGRNSFGYQVLAVAREAVQKHPNPNVRDLQQLESILQVRILNGAPPQNGPMDPDGTGLEAWQVVLYATSISAALEFVQLVLHHKVTKGHLLQQVELRMSAAKTTSSQDSGHAEETNMDVGTDDSTGPIYTVSIFGGIYPYRELFDAACITGGHIAQPDGNRDYVRFLEVQNDDQGRGKVKSIFEQVLLHVPVYLIDSTQTPSDEMVSWISSLPSVELGETAS